MPRRPPGSSPAIAPRPRRARLAVGFATLLCLAAQSPAWSEKCSGDAVPAATLLFPYFEVDLDDPLGKTTLFAVSNRDRVPSLARVVLWTNLGIPTLAFEIYLSGYDIQTLNLRDIFVSGMLPQTGSGVSHHGPLSAAPTQFAGCNSGTVPGLAPVYSDPALNPSQLAELGDFHTGRCHAGMRASYPITSDEPPFEVDRVARGYITVDAVNRCSDLTPAGAGYFVAGGTGIASDRNVLMGDYFFVNARQDFAQSETAVHIEAFPGQFGSESYTFYRRYVGGNGADDREPLATQHYARNLNGGAFDAGTRFMVWRDTGSSSATELLCEQTPDWSGSGSYLQSYFVEFDEQGEAHSNLYGCVTLPPCPVDVFGLATQSVGSFGGTFDFGAIYLVTRRATGSDPSAWPVLQGWLGVVHSAEGRYSVSERAVSLDSACAPGQIRPAPSDFPVP